MLIFYNFKLAALQDYILNMQCVHFISLCVRAKHDEKHASRSTDRLMGQSDSGSFGSDM